MKAIILAGGEAVNLIPFSNTRPIPMIRIAGHTLFDKTLDQLKISGINDIFVVVDHQKEKLIECIGEHINNGLNLHYVEQGKKQGIGNALMMVKDRISPGEYFLLLYGDTITASNIFIKVQQSFHALKSPLASICLPASNEAFGNVFLNAQMKITKLIEKPKDHLGNYVLSGVFILPESFFKILEKCKGSMERALKKMVDEGLHASMWEDEWLDIVHPWEILEANKIIMNSWEKASIAKSAKLESNVTISGIVSIEEDVVIKAGAVLEGPCSIGKGSYIGNNSLVRSFTSIGQNCNVGYGVEMKNCVVQDNTNIGRLSFIGDSVLGENVDIGAGSMTVNRTDDLRPITVRIGNKSISTGLTKLGAFIGDNVIIGAGNSIRPGTIIPPGKVYPSRFTVPSKR